MELRAYQWYFSYDIITYTQPLNHHQPVCDREYPLQPQISGTEKNPNDARRSIRAGTVLSYDFCFFVLHFDLDLDLDLTWALWALSIYTSDLQ
jgi:hypothetical protein